MLVVLDPLAPGTPYTSVLGWRAAAVAGVFTARRRTRASVARMAQQPLAPEGGDSPLIRARIAKRELDEFDQEAARLGITRSEFLRHCLRYGLNHADVVVPRTPVEVDARAS